jgi:hypothetical protein
MLAGSLLLGLRACLIELGTRSLFLLFLLLAMRDKFASNLQCLEVGIPIISS